MNTRRLLTILESTIQPEFIIDRPGNIPHDDLETITHIISEGGQVSLDGLKQRIMQSELVGYAKIGERIVSVRALKNPNASYRESVFRKAGVDDDGYDLELGWAYTLPAFRGKGHSETLARKLLSNAQGSVYATARAENDPPMRLMNKLGFKALGKPYRGMSGMIVLMVREV